MLGVLNLVDVEHVISRTHVGGIKPYERGTCSKQFTRS